MWDVIVVGAGPEGSATAKRCAEYGLNTLLLEKMKLPRDKVCTGLVLEPLAHTAIKQEFGDIPETVLADPYHLSGFMFHVHGIGNVNIDSDALLAWRRDLDYWMNQKAQAKGVEIWQAAKVTALRQKGQGFSVETEKDKRRQELEARFVVGADGAKSVVRKFLFPKLKVSYRKLYQECYQGEIDLDKSYHHIFWYPSQVLAESPLCFEVIQKSNLIKLSVGANAGQMREYMAWVKKFLIKEHHLKIDPKPVWRCGGLSLGYHKSPGFHKELISHAFLPAKGNALLVGDAGGLRLPLTGEGIGTAIKSGLLAANSITRAVELGEQADKIYSKELESLISIYREIYPWVERTAEARRRGGPSLLKFIRDSHYAALRAQG